MFPTPDSPTPPVRLTHLSLPRIYTSPVDDPKAAETKSEYLAAPPAEGYPRRTPLSASPPGTLDPSGTHPHSRDSVSSFSPFSPFGSLRDPSRETQESRERWYPYASASRNSPLTPLRAHMALPPPLQPWRNRDKPALPASLSRLLDPTPFTVRKEHKAPPRLHVFPPQPRAELSPVGLASRSHQWGQGIKTKTENEILLPREAVNLVDDTLTADESDSIVEIEGEGEGGSEGEGSEAVRSDLVFGSSDTAGNRAATGEGAGAGGAMRNGRVLKSRMSHILSEQRRRESINSGFDRLKSMLPLAEEGMTKAQILQQASDYILKLESRVADLVSRQYGRV